MSSWLGLGSELASIGLDGEQEAALDPQARAALVVARVVRPLALRVGGSLPGMESEAAPDGTAVPGRAGGTALGIYDGDSRTAEGDLLATGEPEASGAGKSNAVETSASGPQRNRVQTTWLPFGMELARMSFTPQEEEALDPQARAALGAVRVCSTLLVAVGGGSVGGAEAETAVGGDAGATP